MMNMRWISLWNMNTKLKSRSLLCVCACLRAGQRLTSRSRFSLPPVGPTDLRSLDLSSTGFPSKHLSLLSHLTDLPSDFKVCLLVNFLGLENMQSFKFRLWCKETQHSILSQPNSDLRCPLSLVTFRFRLYRSSSCQAHRTGKNVQ